ncbi:MAG: Nif3-like dinuclear metal center hexameric protein [Candidatus Kapabacteria bacterium]|nr:Nif3-like dinuclear metal center hexameric protein [Candidatus Kapabacteria bacterium]
MLVRDFHQSVDAVLPPETAMQGDAIGLQVASKRSTVDRVLVCLDVTEEVVTEALELGCDAILTFHPLIYSPLARIDRSDRVSRSVYDCIASDLAVLCVHTAFDAFSKGTNHILAELLGLTPVRPLVSDMSSASGMGLLASCSLSYAELVDRVSDVCAGPVRHCPTTKSHVSTVAIVGGSGMSFFNDAVESGADVFITADVKYHGFLDAKGVIGLIDPGHFEMEQFVPRGLVELLGAAIPSVVFIQSMTNSNPIRYWDSTTQQTLTFSSHP